MDISTPGDDQHPDIARVDMGIAAVAVAQGHTEAAARAADRVRKAFLVMGHRTGAAQVGKWLRHHKSGRGKDHVRLTTP